MDKFILHVPEWKGELFFTKDLLVFVGVIILMLVGILFCFWGYKYFRTVLFLGIGTVACYTSYLLVESLTGNLVIRMFLTVSLTFLGICIVYFLDVILGYFLDRLRLRNALGKSTYLFAAPLGAAIIGLTIYYFIWCDPIVAAVTAAVCGVIGLVLQYFKRKKAVRFRCYNDLLQMPLPKVDENGLEYLVMEPVAASVMPEPEPMTETEPITGQEPMTETEPITGPEPMAEIDPETEPISEIETVMDFEPAAEEKTEIVSGQKADETSGELPESFGDVQIEEMEGETETDILEDALFVRQMSEYVKNRRQIKQIDIGLAAMAAGRHAEAVTAAQREAADVMHKAADAMNEAAAAMNRATAAVPGAGLPVTQRRRRNRKQSSRFAKGAAVVAAGIGLFIAGRASKGRD